MMLREVKQVNLDHVLFQYWYASSSQQRKISFNFLIVRKTTAAQNYQKHAERVIFNLETTGLKQMWAENNFTAGLQVVSIPSVHKTQFHVLFYYSNKSSKITSFLQISHQGSLFPRFQYWFTHRYSKEAARTKPPQIIAITKN